MNIFWNSGIGWVVFSCPRSWCQFNFNQTSCSVQVSLVPQSLARKRVWNKKYPIRIEIAKQDDFMSKAEAASEEKDNQDIAGSQDGGRVGSDRELPTIYLFGRTGREKEEWFRRILLASKLKSEAAKKPASLPTSKSGECGGCFHIVNTNTDVFGKKHKYRMRLCHIQ